MKLQEAGFTTAKSSIDADTLEILRGSIFTAGEAGTRCLLDDPTVKSVAISLREDLSSQGLMDKKAIAVQAIAFDKTPSANWKVTWHQDLMFPFATRTKTVEYALACVKDGVNYARPPAGILADMTAVRLHLDDCDEQNGPLRVSPGSHMGGILKSSEIPEHLARHGEFTCLAKEGEVIMMKVLALHASSLASSPRHRRVLHIVYYSGHQTDETWHRTI
jgi:ectoine hydroxylase-related dioxygenase (phytanoyl-CoA dioxygenase family)